MKSLLIKIIPAALLFPLAVFGKAPASANNEYAVSNVPEELKKDAYAIIRNDEITFDVQDLDKAVYKEKIVITILKKEAEEDRRQYFMHYYDVFTKIKNIEGKLYDENGTLVEKLTQGDITDMGMVDYSVFEDSRIRYAHFKYDKYPYTVEYECEVECHNLMNLPSWGILPGEHISLQQGKYTVNIVDKMQLRFKEVNTAVVCDSSADNGIKTYTWKEQNLPQVTYEQFGRDQQLPEILMGLCKFKVDGYEGDMSTWEGFSSFIYLLNKDRDILNDEQAAYVKSIADSFNDIHDRVAAIYRYMQNSTRYVSIQLGIGGYQSFDANYVCKNKFGDCKALSNYMKSMLRAAGIPAVMAIVYAGAGEPDIETDFPSSQFNHAILFVPTHTDTIWLECTSQDAPSGFPGSFTAHRHVLAIMEKGGGLVETPCPKSKDNVKIRKVDAALAESGAANMVVDNTMTGSRQEIFRMISESYTKKQLDDYLHTEITLPAYDLVNYKIKEVDKRKPVVKLEYDISVPHYASASSARLFVTGYPLPPSTNKIPDSLEKRKEPVINKDPIESIDTVVYHLPFPYSPESLPAKGLEFKNDFGSYSAQFIYSAETNTVTYIRHFIFNTFDKPATSYSDFRHFYLKILKADKTQFVLVKKT